MIASHALAALLVLGHTPSDALADSVIRRTIIRATHAYERQDFEGAVQAYAAIPPTPDRPATICYNEGLAFAALQDRARAAQAFRLADLNATDPAMRAAARFNLARIRYENAMELAAREPEQAIEELRDVARTFRSVLEVDPNDADAARNVERVRLEIRRLQEQLRQEAEQQDQRREQMQNLAQQLQQLAERQRQAADESQRAEQQMQQDSAVGAEAARQARSTQDPISEETENLMQQALDMLQQMGETESGQTEVSEALGQMAQARQEQSQADQELSRSQPGPAEQDQRDAADLLQQAAERMSQAGGGEPDERPGQGPGQNQPEQSGEQPGDGRQEQETQAQGPPRQVERTGRADGDPIARRLLEKEILDRANRIRRGPPIPVERDW